MVDTDRLTKGFNIGTVLGTILVAPYNYSAEIYGFRYANPNPLVTVMAELTSQSSGTITATIDEVVLTPGQPVARESLTTGCPGVSTTLSIVVLTPGQPVVR